MIKSSQGVIRTKDLEITRLKQRLQYEPSSVRLPSISSNDNLRKDPAKNLKGLIMKLDKGKQQANELHAALLAAKAYSKQEGSMFSRHHYNERNSTLKEDASHLPDIHNYHREPETGVETELFQASEFVKKGHGIRSQDVNSSGDEGRLRKLSREIDCSQIEPSEIPEEKKKTRRNQGSIFDPSITDDQDISSMVIAFFIAG